MQENDVPLLHCAACFPCAESLPRLVQLPLSPLPGQAEIPCLALVLVFDLVFSRLEKGPNPLVLSLRIVNWLLNPSTRFEPTFSTPDTFQVQILSKVYDKTRVYLILKAIFKFFLFNFLPFLTFHIGVGHNLRHITITIKKQRDLLPVLVFF